MLVESLVLTKYAISALGGGFAVSSIVNGWLNRKQQRDLARENQKFQKELQLAGFEHQEKMQKDMQEFQAKLQFALQERNFRETDRLQKELQQLQFRYSLALQDANFQHQEDAWERTHFIQNNWPLISTPRFYVDMVRQFEKSKAQMPFQIISTDCLGTSYEKINCNVADFFNRNYPISSNAGTLFFNKGWKEVMRNLDGNAQIFALHSALAGLPTLVLMPKIAGSHLVLNASLWGIGDFSLPEIHNVFSVNIDELRLMAIREELSKIKEEIETYSLEPQHILSEVDSFNMQVYEEELSLRNALFDKNLPEDRIEAYINSKVASKYKFRGKEDIIFSTRDKFISTMIAINASIITDFYFLLEYNIRPKLPTLFANEEYSAYRKAVADKYLEMLDRNNFLAQSSSQFYLPYYQALTASSFIEAGEESTARKLQSRALNALDFRYARRKDFADSDIDTYTIISQNNLTAKQLPVF